MKNKTISLTLPAKMADELQTFIRVSGLTDGAALSCLLPSLGPILSDPDEFEATIQGELELTVAEIQRLDAGMAEHFCGG